MRLSDMFRLGQSYFVLGMVLVLITGILFSAGYFFVYKKLMKGTKKPNRKFVILAVISLCYLAIVFGAVFLRHARDTHNFSFHLFSSYKAAWNNFSFATWRGIVLNILLFVPFGFIVPLWGKKLRSFWKVIALGLLFTISIEAIQYTCSLGILDIDDIFNNTLGAAIGGGIALVLLSFKSKRSVKIFRAVIYLAPLVITMIFTAVLVISYNAQEFGNLFYTYNFTNNMKNIVITGNVFPREESKATIYKATVASEEETRAFAIDIFGKTGNTIDDKQSNIYDETAFYKSIDNSVSLMIDYKGLIYSYNNNFNMNSKKDSSVDEKTIRTALSILGVEIPEKAIFTRDDDGRYKFSAEMINASDGIINGYLTCEYGIDGKISYIVNYLVSYKTVKDCSIISPDKAYQMILAGKFNYYDDTKSIETINVRDYILIYSLDSKGFFQPVYKFNVLVNDSERYIYIPALR